MRITALVFILLSSFMSSTFAAFSLQTSSISSSPLFNESRILMSRGQYDDAIRNLESLRKLYPNNSQVFYWLSTASYNKGDINSAISYIKKGITLAPNNSELIFKLAKLYSQNQNYAEAEKEFTFLENNAQSAILRKKVKHEKSLITGFLLLQKGKNEQALSYFQDLVQIFPRDIAIKETLGNIYMSQNLLDEAERTYLQALTIQPNKSSILFSLSSLFKQYGDIDYAHTYLKQIIEQDPGSAAASNAINVALSDSDQMRKKGDFAKAISYIETVTNTISYHKKANTMVSSIYRQQKRYNEAVQALKNILHESPTDWETRVLMSDIYTEAGNINSAIEELNEILTLSPKHNFNVDINTKINILYGKKARELGKQLDNDQAILEGIKTAQTWFDNGRYDTAQWLIESVITKSPRLHDAHLILGRIYAKRSQFKRALQEFSFAIQLDHDTVEARQEYANVLEILGDYQSAEAVYFDMLPLIKSPVVAKKIDTSISLVKAEKHRQKGQFQSALAIYKDLNKRDPDDIRTLQHMGNIYLSIGDTDKAELIFERLIKAEHLMEKQFTLLKRGRTLLNQRNYSDSRKAFEEVIALNPSNAQAHYLLSISYSKEGKLKDALSSIGKSTEYDPTNLTLKLEHARLLTISGDLDHASRLYETVFRNTNDPVKRKDIKRLSSFVKGQYLIKQGKYFDAIQHYEAATQIFPHDSEMHEALASLYYTQNLTEEALSVYSKVLELTPTKFRIHNQLADLYGRQGDKSRQIEHLKTTFLNQSDSSASAIAEKKILAIAQAEIQNKEYSQANMKLVLILSKNPQNTSASFILANLYRINKKYEKAESVYYQILATKPVDLDTRSLLASLYLENRKHDNAIIEYEKIVSLSPTSNLGKEARSKLNVLLLEKADQLVSKSKTEKDVNLLLETALEWFDKGYFEASQWLLSNITQRQPENALATFWLGELYIAKGDTKPGLDHLYRAAKLDKTNFEYRLRFGQALAQNKLYEEAIKHLQTVIDKSKNQELILKAKQGMVNANGRLLIQNKEYKKALAHFSSAAKNYDINYDVDIAESLILLKKTDKAESLLLKNLRNNDQNSVAHGLLARIYKDKGKIKEHLIHLDKAWLEIPGEGLSETSIVNLNLQEGFKKLKSKTWGDAIMEFNRSLNRDPNNLYAILGKHVALYNSGNLQQANTLLIGLLKEKEKTMNAKLRFLEVRSLVSQ